MCVPIRRDATSARVLCVCMRADRAIQIYITDLLKYYTMSSYEQHYDGGLSIVQS